MSTAAPEAQGSAAHLNSPALVVTDLCKSIGGRRLLSRVSLSIVAGQIHGLLGPNGSGKTTLLRMLAGIWRADSGHIARLHGSMAQIGYVPQRFCLYDELTVHENLRFQAKMRGCAMQVVAQAERVFELAPLLTQRAGALSGGQRQRLLIAVALLHRPTLLLLDEPTTALDTAARQALWELLRREADNGTTIVLTTHETADAQHCDAITQLVEGRVVNEEASA